MEKHFKCKHDTEIPVLISENSSMNYHNLPCCRICIEFKNRPLEYEGWYIFSLNSIDNKANRIISYNSFGKYNHSDFTMYVFYSNPNKIVINWADLKFSAQKQFDFLYKIYENLIFE